MEKLIPFVFINLFLVVFYAIFWLFLKKETFHQANRFYLLMSTLFSVILPFLQFSEVKSWGLTYQFQTMVYTYNLPELVVSQNSEEKLSWVLIISIIYLTVVALLFMKLAYGIARAYAIVQKASFLAYNAFSFFGIIKIDKKLPFFKTIRAHERVHTLQFHFLDLFFFELLSVVFWCNPVVMFYKFSIKNIHEFLADEKASATLNSSAEYATLLLSKQFKIAPEHLFVQPFYNKSTLKIRIQMLMKGKSKRWAMLKYGALVPILFVFVVLSSVSCSEKDPMATEFNTINTNAVNKVFQKDGEPIFTAVETYPEFPGGVGAMYKFLSENIKYPSAAQRANVSGRVFVKFIVEKDGSIAIVEVMKGIGFGCDEEAKRVIMSMPRWNPGLQNGKNVRVYYNMPVVYKLE